MASTPSKRRRQAKDVRDPKEASKVELVAATLFLIGGDARFVLLDELALSCHRLAPDAFCWPEYLWLPSLDSVRVTLVDVKRAGLVEEGSEKRGRTLKGIRLTQEGREWAGRNEQYLGSLRRRLPDPARYMNQAEGELAAVAVLSASEGVGGKHVSRERVVAEAFRLFPERFALPQFPGWPDSARLEQAAHGSPWVDVSQAEWTIDSEHRAQVEQVRAELHVESREGFGASRRRQVMGTAHRAVQIIESAALFQRFRREQTAATISEDDVCDILAVTLESKPAVIQKHLDARIRLVEQAERWDLVEFLKFIGAWCAARDFNLTQ
jgi:hypothetical protein